MKLKFNYNLNDPKYQYLYIQQQKLVDQLQEERCKNLLRAAFNLEKYNNTDYDNTSYDFSGFSNNPNM